MFLLRTEDSCLQFSADEIRGIYLLVSSDDGSGHIDIETRDGKLFKAAFSRGDTAADKYAFWHLIFPMELIVSLILRIANDGFGFENRDGCGFDRGLPLAAAQGRK